MTDKNELQQKVLNEEDYVRAPKFSNSLAKFVARNSDGVENATIARLLMIPEDQVEKIYEEAVELLREEMVDED
jgi:hypothetical protein